MQHRARRCLADIVLTVEPDDDGPIPLPSVRLIVEVADTTVAQDLDRKQRLYACHAIPEYWFAVRYEP